MSISRLVSASVLALGCALSPMAAHAQIDKITPAHKIMPMQARIQIALLLDTSNSMDGLISQAKSQLWTLVNELAEGEKHGRAPIIELALYEYGNSNISVSKGYIRRVLSLTTDLDGVSEKLFALTTSGGQEFAGQAIMTSLEELEWSLRKDDMKLIIIAGNEPFTQGSVSYEKACGRARRGGIIIDTVYCGDERRGIKTKWKDGADCAGGIYMTINQDEKAVYIPSPYDDDILSLNKKLNDTYIGYGQTGSAMKQRQSAQDSNAGKSGISSVMQRTKSKASKAYSNKNWDIVDAYEANEEQVLNMEEAKLPSELKGKTTAERKVFIEEKQVERAAVQKQITDLSKKQQQFVSAKRKEMTATKTLDNVMVEAVRKQAKQSGFKYK